MSEPSGRPSIYSEELAAAICERLAKGEPLARICEDPAMPGYTTVWRWERANEDFRKRSAHAREIGTHYIADDCIRIADDGEIDPQHKRIQIDTRLRLIGKWNARGYGDRVQTEVTGANGGPIQTVDLSKVSDDDLDRLEAILGRAAVAVSDQGGTRTPEG